MVTTYGAPPIVISRFSALSSFVVMCRPYRASLPRERPAERADQRQRREREKTAMRRRPDLCARILRFAIEAAVHARVARDGLVQIVAVRGIGRLFGLLAVVAFPRKEAVEEPGDDARADDRLGRRCADPQLAPPML